MVEEEVKQESHTEQPSERCKLSCRVSTNKKLATVDDETGLKLFTAFFHTLPHQMLIRVY